MKKTIKRRSDFSGAGSPSLQERIFLARSLEKDYRADYRLADLIPPTDMKGVTKAVDILFSALNNQLKVLVVGDFDADGATSSALAVLCLRDFGFDKVDYLVPNRFEYGYGLTPEIVDVAKSATPDVIITVDNGISSIEGVEEAKRAGFKVIITDHHLPGDELPLADAIVNPNQKGCEFKSKNLAGVGVIFYLLSALRAKLRDINWFDLRAIPEPNMTQYLDLVALGTVADVVPLDHNNRILVHQGLARIRAGRGRPGIQALFEVSKRRIDVAVANDFAFAVGPRLNAAGRLDDMSIGIKCLLESSLGSARNYAAELDELNRERRAIENVMKAEANEAIERLPKKELVLTKGICLFHEDWHQGVIGIVASRVKESMHKPTIVFARVDDHEIKGSGRSIPGVHLRDVLDLVAKKHPSLLSKFGGHAMAAGLSIRLEDFEAFREYFNHAVEEFADNDIFDPVLFTDGLLSPAELSMESAEMIRHLSPWGQSFPEPTFDGEFDIVQQRLVGEKHLKLVVTTVEVSTHVYDAIAFNVDLKIWPNESCSRVKLVYKLDVNEFRGKRSLQLMVDYMEPIFA